MTKRRMKRRWRGHTSKYLMCRNDNHEDGKGNELYGAVYI